MRSLPAEPSSALDGTPAVLGAVWLGGALGSLLRWGLEQMVPSAAGWPWPTLVVNVLGSAALAWLVVAGARHHLPAWFRSGLGTGLIGGFTTFSTYAVQVTVLGTVHPVASLGYLVLTPVLCVAAATVAGELTRRAGSR